MALTLLCGDSSTWKGDRPDLVFTHPYAPLPEAVRGVPAILNIFHPVKPTGEDRKKRTERWVGSPLTEIGRWGKGHRNAIYIAGMKPRTVRIDKLVEDEFEPGRGWMPLELPMRLLRAYGSPGITVWDGFCGRGTIGKACQALGMDYIGIDRDPARVAIAREYLGC